MFVKKQTFSAFSLVRGSNSNLKIKEPQRERILSVKPYFVYSLDPLTEDINKTLYAARNVKLGVAKSPHIFAAFNLNNSTADQLFAKS